MSSDNVEGILLSVSYDPQVNRAKAKLYDPKSEKLIYHIDKTGHLPYLLTNLTPEELKQNYPAVIGHSGLKGFEVVERYDILNDKRIRLTKIIARDPLSVGGTRNSLRELVPKTWEDDIKYYNCYIYDLGLIPGLPYIIDEEALIPKPMEIDEKIRTEISKIFDGEPQEFKNELELWLPLFQYPVPTIKRAALDIEVATIKEDRIANPSEAENPVICVAFSSTDNKKLVLLLDRGLEKEELKKTPFEVEVYQEERDLIKRVFQIIDQYPLLLTFNGDNFDLRYLYHRAEKLGIPQNQVPIVLGREMANLKNGIHIDLYKFFHNTSIQVYAFSNKYKLTTLDAIAEALLGEKKIEISKQIDELSLKELAEYCFQDADLTLKLTTFNNELVMKLIVLLMRITKLPMEDLTRLGISRWIQNLFNYEHRRRGILIPKLEDIAEAKGGATSAPIIKGKQYKGAIVIEPHPGVHFNVVVLDFASLYPSIIMRKNLGYDTIRCPHSQCKSNKVPETDHWICTKRRSIVSLIIGLLRQLRVGWFKPKSKDPKIPPQQREFYHVIQSALKVLLNASYGVFGAEHFAFYCLPVAESTTAIGRQAIKDTIKKSQELGLEVIYGDTDSVFIANPDEEKLQILMNWSKKGLGIELDVDKRYRYCALSERKKNYLGVFPDGSIDIKGLTGKKRNTPEFLQRAFMQMMDVLSKVESPKDFQYAKKKIREIVKECYQKLRNREYTLEDLAFRVMLTKPLDSYVKTTPQHVKAARQLKALNHSIVAGDIISFVKVKSGVKPVQTARIEEIDVDKYLEHIKTTFEQVLDALGIDFGEILGATTLDMFI